MGETPSEGGVDERLRLAFLAFAGTWLQTGEPPIVKHVHGILRECGIVGASALTMNRVIDKLVEMRWLAPRPYGEKLSRYVPTLLGFAKFAMEPASVDKERCLLERGIDVQFVRRIGVALTFLSAVMAKAWTFYKGRYVPPLDDDLLVLAKAIGEGKAADEVARHVLEKAVQSIPRLRCFFANYVFGELLLALAFAAKAEPDALVFLDKTAELYLALGNSCKDAAPEVYYNAQHFQDVAKRAKEELLKLRQALSSGQDT